MLLNNSVMRNLGGFDCINNEKKTVMNKNGICLVFKWRVQLALNSTVNFVSYLYGHLTPMWLIEVPPTSFSGNHVDSILNFTVTKQKQPGIQVS